MSCRLGKRVGWAAGLGILSERVLEDISFGLPADPGLALYEEGQPCDELMTMTA